MPIPSSGNFDILRAYYIAGTNPTTQVFSTVLGIETFISNGDADFIAWLTAGGFGFMTNIVSAANNGSGAIRLTLLDGSLLQSGQVFHVDGSAAYDANYVITKISTNVVDLVGSTFTGASVADATLKGAAIVATDAALWSVFDDYAQRAWKSTALTLTGVSLTTQLSSPIPGYTTFISDGSGHYRLRLPKARTPRSIPKGREFQVKHDATSPIAIMLVDDFAGTILQFLMRGDTIRFVLSDNSTPTGTYQIVSPSNFQGQSRVQYGHGRRNAAFTDDIDFTCNTISFVSMSYPPRALPPFILGGASADISTAGPIVRGRDQAAAFVAGDVIHWYYILSEVGLAQDAITSKQPPAAGGPTLPTGYTHWAYAASFVLIAGPLFPDVHISGSFVGFRNPTVDTLVLNAGAAVAETSIAAAINAKVPQFTCTNIKLFVSGTTTNANTLKLYNAVGKLMVSIPVPAGARVAFELNVVPDEASPRYVAYAWGVATGTVDITVLGYNVANGDN